MRTTKRLAAAIATIGLFSAATLVATGAATDSAEAAGLVCKTQISGVLPNGKLVERDITNTRFVSEKKTATALPYRVDWMYFTYSETTTGGYVEHLVAHTAGQPARAVHVTNLDASTILSAKVAGRYRPSPKGRLFASSGRYFTYGVDASGNLTRWTRFLDDAGHLWFGSPRIVKRGMGGLKTLSFMFWGRIGANNVRTDFLYGTTSSGALKQIQIPWSTPGKPKITTLKTTGFASYTSLSLSWCNQSGTIGSIIAIDKTHNQARWYTLGRQFSPNGRNLVRHPLVAPGIQWRLHATS